MILRGLGAVFDVEVGDRYGLMAALGVGMWISFVFGWRPEEIEQRARAAGRWELEIPGWWVALIVSAGILTAGTVDAILDGSPDWPWYGLGAVVASSLAWLAGYLRRRRDTGHG